MAFFWSQMCIKSIFGKSPEPAEAAYNAPPDLLYVLFLANQITTQSHSLTFSAGGNQLSIHNEEINIMHLINKN